MEEQTLNRTYPPQKPCIFGKNTPLEE